MKSADPHCGTASVMSTAWRFVLLLVLLIGGAAHAQVPNDIAIGALRWDSWHDGAREIRVLEQPEWAFRAPFYARHDEHGKLRLDGDKEHVLHAEVAYARAIGIDYFIFGFYPDTGSWGREASKFLKLDRALQSYLRLPDRMGVKFALSLNQLFPTTDVEDISASLASFVAHPDYMRTPSGTVPVFVFAQGADALDLAKYFGSQDKARQAFQDMRRITRERTGREITLIILSTQLALAKEAAARYGIDMVSAYTAAAPGKDAVEIPFNACMRHAETMWDEARRNAIPYAPNITLGWDNRPRTPVGVDETIKGQGPWCASASPKELQEYFRNAEASLARQSPPPPLKSIVVYAWNEFSEGGWMAPNQGESGQKMLALRQAIGRSHRQRSLVLTWPDNTTIASCPIRAAGRTEENVIANCKTKLARPRGWPCPAGMHADQDIIRAPSGYESLIWEGGWHARRCAPDP